MDYQVGGSLAPDAPSYVERHADRQLYRSLLDGQFCYVLTSRQMGKSSLLVRTRARLQREGCRCATLDLGAVGCEGISPEQWYKGVLTELWRGFELFGDGNFKTWWQQVSELGTIQKLRGFLDELLRHRFSGERLFIFIDEVDSILNLEFAVDDFFALIRFCHEYRAIDPNYNRLTFAIFGVATPSDLIRDKSRTPFNIGTAISLDGFALEEAEALVAGLAFGWGNERAVLREILAQTNGQPFLTQKLCQLARERLEFQTVDGKISPAEWIAEIVRDRLVRHWESQDEPEHLRTIRDRLLHNEDRSSRLLGLYQQILQAEIADNSPEALELILSGLLVKKNGILQVKNRIYRQIFTREWVETQLQNLRPYWQTLTAWVASRERDESRLLRGQALAEARSWSQGKRLSDLDRRFLAASQEFDRREWQKILEADRAAEMALRLDLERKVARLQRLLLGVVSLAFAIATALGLVASQQYHQATLSQIEAIATSSDALFANDRRLDALVAAIKAQKSLQKLNSVPPDLRDYADKVLRQAVYDALEFNRLSGQDSRVWGVAFSPQGDRIATANGDNTVKLWQSDGKLLATLSNHLGPVWGVAFSPDGKIVASASWDKTVKLWDLDGKLRSTLTGHRGAVWDVAFSPDGQMIASASEDKTVKLWSADGTLLRTLAGHGATVWDVAFSPDGKILATASDDRTVKLRSRDGTLLQTLEGHGAAVWKVAFSPDGKTIASASWDGTVRLWKPDGRAIAILEGHGDRVRDVAFSPDGRVLASASEDRTVKLWNWDGAFLHVLNGHQAGVIAVSFSRDDRTVAFGTDFKCRSPDLCLRLGAGLPADECRFGRGRSGIVQVLNLEIARVSIVNCDTTLTF
ncbi:MAG: hypothetical protein D6728_16320 [Cyanobacteria bacterium J055]|nr:MAG: hypothetical protein D6728_16320 [Cyanobacteria bacterium J055]